MKMSSRLLILTLSFLLLSTPGLFFGIASAQIGQGIESEEEDISPGTIISRDPRSNYFHLSRGVSDPNIFGVVVEKPIANIRPDEESDISVLRTGEVEVRVILKENSIETGDYITTSEVEGLGMRASDDHSNVLGVALENFTSEDAESSVEYQEEDVPMGLVLVDLQIGNRQREEGSVPPGEDNNGLTPLGSQVEHYLAMIARYLAAALVAISALYLSFRFFKSNVAGGLSALGRNPLARQSIQKMMLFNMFLVIIISVGGLLLSALILLIPVFISRII
ncbi:MAG: hypothetical protein ACQEP6_00185 [Patescibacteria group bacterium]